MDLRVDRPQALAVRLTLPLGNCCIVPAPLLPYEIHRAKAPIYALCALGDGVIAGCGDGAVLRWCAGSPDRIELAAQAPASIFGLCAIGPMSFAIGTAAGELIIVDLKARIAVQRITAHASAIHAITMIGTDRMASAGADGCLVIWQHAHGNWTLLRRIPITDNKLRGLTVSTDGGLIALACGDGFVRLLDTELFNELGTFPGHEGGANCAAFHPGKAALLSGGKDGHLRAWDLRDSPRELVSVAAHHSTVYGIGFNQSGSRFATASRDKTAKLWDAEDLNVLQRLDARAKGHAHSVNALAWLNDELITAGDDRKLIRWAADQNG